MMMMMMMMMAHDLLLARGLLALSEVDCAGGGDHTLRLTLPLWW